MVRRDHLIKKKNKTHTHTHKTPNKTKNPNKNDTPRSHVLFLEQDLRTRVLKYFEVKLNSKLIQLRKKYIF